MNIQQEKMKAYVEAAIADFNANEQYLVRNDLSERCICAKFATYLEKQIKQSEFSDYVVDVEYNRGYMGKEHTIKRLYGRNIVVDLIVHKRGFDQRTGFNNLICIEMKKGYKRLEYSNDKERLRALTGKYNGFRYLAGFMIEVFANKRADAFGLRIDEEFYMN
ncbi:MAG: hypothetical protein IJ466_04815 [Clostridia bacterium]|nr:hypothetical protein [Clostridia bacterium]